MISDIITGESVKSSMSSDSVTVKHNQAELSKLEAQTANNV